MSDTHAPEPAHGHDPAHAHAAPAADGGAHGHGHGPAGGTDVSALALAYPEANPDALKHVIPNEHGHHDDHHGEAAHLVDKPLGPPRKGVFVGDVEFSVIDQGTGPTILFLHGFPTSASLWRHVIADLSKEFRCVAPDLLGLGHTECPTDADFSLDRQADLMLQLLDALGVAGEVAIVGHDIGGIVAQCIAATTPERISKLVLVDSPAFTSDLPPVMRRLSAAARFSFVWDFLADTGFLRWFAFSDGGMRAGAYEMNALPDEAITEYMSPIYRDTPPAYREARERFRLSLREFVRNEVEILPAVADGLRRFEKPTLVAWGCDDPYISLSYGKKLADEIPGCVGFELIPFCGHWVPEEKPKVLATLIRGHMQGPGDLAAAGASAASAAAAGAKVAAAAEAAIPE